MFLYGLKKLRREGMSHAIIYLLFCEDETNATKQEILAAGSFDSANAFRLLLASRTTFYFD